MSGALARLRVRLVLALGAAEVRLRLWFPRLTQALTRQRSRPTAPFQELVRIESDPAYRALFFAELEAALAERLATRTAVVDEIEAAADRLRSVVRRDDDKRDDNKRGNAEQGNHKRGDHERAA